MQQEWVDRNFLASSHVNTPDPRQLNPPEGQRLLIAWRFSSNMIDDGLSLSLTIRFWNNEEEVFTYPICTPHGYKALNFFEEKILTYKIEVINHAGDLLETWEHHFWTKLIDVDRRSSSVSSQPRHGSVMETP